jgi:integrase
MLGPMSVDLFVGGRGPSQSLFRTTVCKSVNGMFSERRRPPRKRPSGWSKGDAWLACFSECSRWVFPAPEGGHLSYSGFRSRFWVPAVQRAGFEQVTPHALRHTAAAIMIDQGADPLQVQKRLGHKDISTTLRIYGHLPRAR